MKQMEFELNKYLGLWYELVHYPSFFERNDIYNVTAEYSIGSNNTVMVKNSAIRNGVLVESHGTAAKAHNGNNIRFSDGTMPLASLRVSFPQMETLKVEQAFGTIAPISSLPQDAPNYLVDKIWSDPEGNYIFAIVSDPLRQSLYVLSRLSNPPLAYYNTIMKYVSEHYDSSKLVQVPHYH